MTKLDPTNLAESLAYTRRVLEMSRNSPTQELAKWKESLDKDPLRAFKWAEGAVRAAAELEFYSRIENLLNFVEANAKDEGLRTKVEAGLQRYLEQAMNSALEQSTNAISNEAGRFELRVVKNYIGVSEWDQSWRRSVLEVVAFAEAEK